MFSYIAKSPILLLGWTRPDKVRQSLAAIARVKPARLFVSLDGPRDSTDRVLINKTIALVHKSVDWPCDLQIKVADSHLGLRRAVVGGIEWFFHHVEEGIIVEDDCVGSEDFFRFCDEMLERYRSVPNILQIAGDNSVSVGRMKKTSYSFISYPHIWGWATWKRAWQKYDDGLEGWRGHRDRGTTREVFRSRLQQKIWEPIFDRLADDNVPDTWDWRWTASAFLERGLSIQPHRNLVSNVGFGSTATHTKRITYRSNAATTSIFPLVHPRVVKTDRRVESQVTRRQRRDLLGKKSVSSRLRGTLSSRVLGALRIVQSGALLVRLLGLSASERSKTPAGSS